jgi:nucleoside-diphosphate kinase
MFTTYSYKLVAMKLVSPSKEHLEKHYADLSDKPFFKGLVTCTSPRLPPTKGLC